ATFILVRHWRAGGAGLVFTYVLSFGAMHWLASAIYVLPWYTSSAVDYTLIGLEVATIGMAMFAVGGEIGSAMFRRFGPLPAEADEPQPVSAGLVNAYLFG